MPYVQPAVVIQEGQLLHLPDSTRPYFGPVRYGTDKFIYGENDIFSASLKAQFYKSTDGGFTWSAADVANTPTVVWRSNAFDVTSGTDWHVAWASNASWNTVHFQLFNLATSLYEADWSTLVLADNLDLPEEGICLCVYPGTSPAEFIFIYQTATGSTRAINFRIWDGDSWSSEVRIDEDDTGSYRFKLANIVIDDNARAHLFVHKYELGMLTSALRHIVINSDGSYGPWQTVIADFNLTYDEVLTAIYRDESDEIFLSYSKYINGSSQEAGVYRGTPSSSPVFTKDAVITTGAYDPDSWPTIAVSHEGDYSNVCLIWSQDAFDTSAAQIYCSIYNGTSWASPVLLYDAEVDPPQMDETWALQGLEQTSATIFNDGGTTWFGIVLGGLLVVTDEFMSCNMMWYVEAPAAGIALRLNVSVDDSFELLDALSTWLSPGLTPLQVAVADYMWMLSALPSGSPRLSVGSRIVRSVIESCDLLVASEYCTGFKTYRDNTLEEVEDWTSRLDIYEVGAETCS